MRELVNGKPPRGGGFLSIKMEESDDSNSEGCRDNNYPEEDDDDLDDEVLNIFGFFFLIYTLMFLCFQIIPRKMAMMWMVRFFFGRGGFYSGGSNAE